MDIVTDNQKYLSKWDYGGTLDQQTFSQYILYLLTCFNICTC